MSLDQSPPVPPDAPERDGPVDAAAIEADSPNATWGDRRGVPELYVKSPRLARIGVALLTAFVAIGTARWAWTAYELSRPPELVCAGCAPDWYRWTQLVLAIAGIIVALVTMAYLAYFASTGRIWRRWRGVATTFGILAASWTALWWFVALV
jgi:hypothetical protein